jgi:hypothetical protein
VEEAGLKPPSDAKVIVIPGANHLTWRILRERALANCALKLLLPQTKGSALE